MKSRVLLLGLTAAMLLLAAEVHAALYSFAGSNTGAIPDSLNTGPAQYTGGSRVVNFAVAGLPGSPLTMSLSITLTHTFVGDLDVVLSSPGGTAFTIFSRVGAATAPSAGDSSNLGGPYTFTDTAADSFWTAAAAAGAAANIPAGSYRTSSPGPGTGSATSFDAAYSSLTPAEANGTWTLTFRDGWIGDFGTVSAATLEITAVPEVNPGFVAAAFCALICLRTVFGKRKQTA